MNRTDPSDSDVDFQAIAELQSDLIFRLDAEGRIRYVSRDAERFFGYSPEESLGAHFSELLDQREEERARAAFRELLTGEPVEGLELELGGEDSSVRLARISTEPVVEDGTVVGVRGVAVDITDRRRRTQVVEVLDRVLRHNLRNAMNIVVGEATRMRDESDDPAATKAGERIWNAGKDLLELADAARDLQRVVGEQDRSDPPDAVAGIRSACTLLAEQFPDASLTVDLAVESAHVPDTGFDVAIRELVENALKHGGSDPEVTVELTQPTPETVRIRVADDGPGLPEMEQAVLREGRENPLQHGQGLGLWLVNWVVREADGRMRLDADEGDGTTITVDLPRVDPAAEAVEGPSAGADADD